MSAIYNEIGFDYDATRCADPEVLNLLSIWHQEELSKSWKVMEIRLTIIALLLRRSN